VIGVLLSVILTAILPATSREEVSASLRKEVARA
jgi:hypothetical protein